MSPLLNIEEMAEGLQESLDKVFSALSLLLVIGRGRGRGGCGSVFGVLQ